MTDEAALIVNPVASGVTPELVAAVEAELAPVETSLTEYSGHATELAADLSHTSSRVYVLAGDGGMNEAVNGLRPGPAVGFLPGGATNVVPRALGLPRDPVQCARLLARSDAERTISLGRVNERRFLFAAGIGLDAEIVRAVDSLGRTTGRRPGDVAFVWQLVRVLAVRRARLEPALTVDGLGRAAFALVANCDPYTYVGRLRVRAAPDARFELGLDLVAPRQVGVRRLFTLAYWALVRPGQTTSEDVLYLHDADYLRVVCDEPLPLQADGEDLGDIEEAEFAAERNALRVVVPGDAGAVD